MCMGTQTCVTLLENGFPPKLLNCMRNIHMVMHICGYLIVQNNVILSIQGLEDQKTDFLIIHALN